ncbi:Protein CONTINUOUS VASCULAR RING 1 [Linum perenne]
MNRKKIKTLEISKQLDNSFHPRLANYCLQIETKAYYCPAGRREIRLRESSLLLLLLLHCRRRLSLLSSGRFWKEYNQRRLILSLFGGVMADDKSAIVMTSMEPNREPDRELLIHVSDAGGRDTVSPKPSSSSSHHHSGRETFSKVIRSWASKKFMTGCVILFPIAITFYITWWFIHFVDGFFSPIYAQLGINIFVGASVLSLGEWFIKRMPFVRHIYNASKQIGAAISPNTQAFKEVAIIRHPRIGEYAFGFITSSVTLQNYAGDEELCCVYVPTNHLYIGDIFLVSANDVIRPNLSVREGIDTEIVVSGGMSMPQMLSTLDSHVTVDRNRLSRS